MIQKMQTDIKMISKEISSLLSIRLNLFCTEYDGIVG
jgi:hypothetical protein